MVLPASNGTSSSLTNMTLPSVHVHKHSKTRSPKHGLEHFSKWPRRVLHWFLALLAVVGQTTQSQCHGPLKSKTDQPRKPPALLRTCRSFPGRFVSWIFLALCVTHLLYLCIERQQQQYQPETASMNQVEWEQIWRQRRRKRFSVEPVSPLRQAFEARYGDNEQNIGDQTRRAVQALQSPSLEKIQPLSSCPTWTFLGSPPQPRTWPLLDILKHWNPNDVKLPPPPESSSTAWSSSSSSWHYYHSLCVLDWNVHSLETIQAYRQAEIPFVLKNHPEWMRAAERWNSVVENTPGSSPTEIPYWIRLVQDEGPQMTEYGVETNRLTFWRETSPFPKPGWEPPTTLINTTIQQWWQHAQDLEKITEQDSNAHVTMDHYYWRFNANTGTHNYLYDELRPFRPDAVDEVFMAQPEQDRGINCRFGMTGSLADNHFDASRNWLAVLKGTRRYILAPPEQCEHLHLHPTGHVSARHSQEHWAHLPTNETAAQEYQHAQALQVVLQAGEALYLPTSWFHFIVSLDTTIQCNARSGSTHTQESHLHKVFRKCGFDFHV